MDFSFKSPNMELFVLLHQARDKDPKALEALKDYVVQHSMYKVYTDLVQKDLIKNNKEELNLIITSKDNKLNELLELKQKDPENSTYVHSIAVQIAELHASSLDVEEACEEMRLLLKEETSLSFQMDVFLCQIRMGILTKDKKLVEKGIEEAKDIYFRGCDWDRRNKFKIYQGIYYLMKGNFVECARYLNESLPSFEANEMIGYKEAVQYLVFSGLLAYNRIEVKNKLLECSEVNEVGSREALSLIHNFYNCNYYEILPAIYKFLSSVKDDVYLSHFIDYFCKEVKLKAYKQLLDSYQFISLSNMAQLFGMEEGFLEEDLASFIVEGKLNCKIDKIDGLILNEESVDVNIQKVIEKGENLVKLVKKNVK